MQLGFVKSGTWESTHGTHSHTKKKMEVYSNIPVHHSEIRIDCGIAFNREHKRQAKAS